MSISTLSITSASCTSLDAGVTLDCVCPIDGFMWTQTVSLGADPFPSPFDFNQLVTFPIPAHEDDGQPCSETNVSLYVAVHSDQNGIIACVSSNAIPSDWWENDS